MGIQQKLAIWSRTELQPTWLAHVTWEIFNLAVRSTMGSFTERAVKHKIGYGDDDGDIENPHTGIKNMDMNNCMDVHTE
jgi:hypothetical protein